MSYLQQQIASLLRSAAVIEPIEPYYEVLEYIYLDGTQFFNPDLLTNSDYTIEARFKLTDTSGSSSVFGGRNSSSNPMNGNQLHYIYTNGKTQYIGGLSNSELAVENAITVNDVCEVVCDNTGFSIAKNGGEPVKYSRAFSTIQYTTDLMICATYTKTGNSLQWGFRGELYTFKVFLNNALIRDYVPVLDNQMRPCLYERVSKTFLYAKKVSGGATAYDLGFKRWNKYDVDYIENTGEGTATATAIQYINTGIIPKGTIISGKIKYCYLDTPVTEAILGGTTADNTSNVRIGTLSGKYRLKWNNASYTGTTSITAGTILEDEFNTDTGFYTNDVQTMTQQYTSVAGCTNPILLFTDTTTGTNLGYNKVGKRLYYCTIYQDGVLVRDYKPSVRTYNDGTNVVTKAFLYDEVYNKAYDNAGTGSFKAYIQASREVYNLSIHDTMDTDGFYLAEDGTKTVSSDGTSCYTEAIQVKEGDIIEWTVTAEAVAANKRIHGYTTDADIATGQKGSWVEMLAKIVFSTTSDTTQTATFTVPSGVNYIRLSHANVREFKDSIVRIRTYEVGKAIKYPQNNGFTLDAPNSSNFIVDLLTRATTTSSYYILDTRQQTGSSNIEEFGIGGSSTGATVNWKCESESNEVKTNGVSWTRTSNYTYSQMLVGYKDGNTFKRTASFYDFNNQKISDVEIVTATRDITNNTKPLTILHTTSSNWIQNGAEIHYFKYLQDGNDVWYDCIPVRNATVTSSVLLFDRVNNTSLPNTGSGTPTFVALD